MIVVERTFAVTAAPAAVLGYLRDFANAAEWDLSARRTTRVGDGPIVPGARWRHVRKVLWVTAELTYTLITDEPGRLLFHGRNEGATSIDTVQIRPAPGGTEVSYQVELELHGLAKLATALVRAEVEKLATAAVEVATTSLSGPTPARRRLGAATPSRLPTPAEETG